MSARPSAGGDVTRSSLQWSTLALIATQVVHALTPAETASEGWVGAVGGALLLTSAGVALVAVRTGRPWGPLVTGWTGLLVAAGFTVYHALPFRSAVTNPYLGEPVGAPAWISVVLAVGAGTWAAYEGLVRSRHGPFQAE